MVYMNQLNVKGKVLYISRNSGKNVNKRISRRKKDGRKQNEKYSST